LEGFALGFLFCFPCVLSLRLHIIGFGENPTCTNPSNISKIFINLTVLFANMTTRCCGEMMQKYHYTRKRYCAYCGKGSD